MLQGKADTNIACQTGNTALLLAAHYGQDGVVRQLEKDLDAILYGKVPRAYGEMPAKLGRYKRLAPASPEYERAMRLKRAHLRSHRR